MKEEKIKMMLASCMLFQLYLRQRRSQETVKKYLKIFFKQVVAELWVFFFV